VCGQNVQVCIFMKETWKVNMLWKTVWEINCVVCKNYTLVEIL
jgi:hypothetical protein